MLDLHILPELGHLPVASVERSHVSDLHFRMRDKPAQANHAVEILSNVNGGVIMRQIGGVKMHHGLGGSLSA